ncbi:apocytochrome b [Ceraceosorus bombacis]|uniref:Cytochrome b n=1 Tax=Ceraceosorus bombacis TaxID=401625 RepID=A0A0P1A3F3_9BASI|nr:apocytochrome b [Ceraceosorus bombacis]
MPILDTSRVRGIQFRGIAQFFFGTFLVCFFILMFIGSQHVAEPFTTVGTIATVYYFAYFIVVVPAVGIIENTLMDIALDKSRYNYIYWKDNRQRYDVIIPKSTGIKPREVSFTVAKNGNKEKALSTAIEYRETTLTTWFTKVLKEYDETNPLISVRGTEEP